MVVRNEGDVTASNVIIDSFPDSYSGFLDDNSFYLPVGEEKTISFELG